jgi:hypothetical protein
MCFVDDEFGFGLPVSKQDVRVTRIDVVRNLTFASTSDIDPFFRGHQDRRPKWSRRNQTHTRKGGTTGVDKGGKSRSVRMYDKYVESGGRCDAGVVRWEARLRTGALRNLGIAALPDLTPSSIENARSAMWAWSRMDEQIRVGSRLPGELKRKLDSGEATLGDAKAVLHEAVLGGHGGSPSTRNRARETMRRLGLSAYMGSDEANHKHFLTADYATGRVTRI